MAKARTVLSKKRRGPAPTGVGVLIGVRLQPPLLAALDKFISAKDEAPSRPEAIREILEGALMPVKVVVKLRRE